MKTRTLLRLSVVLACLGLLSVAVAAQDFQRTYRLGAGGRINIRNISGQVIVTGYDGETITVSGFKEGRDRDLVEVEDASTANYVNIRARYPEDCRCQASIRFQVQVPRSVNYDFDSITSVSGEVEVVGVTGTLRAQSISGGVVVRDVSGSVNASSTSGGVRVREVAGPVSAQSISGGVEVEITRLEGSHRMEFSSTSGSVNVRVPGNLDAEVEMSTLSGTISTDFPIQLQAGEFNPRKSLRGRIGNGTGNLRLSSISGSVSLKRQ